MTLLGSLPAAVLACDEASRRAGSDDSGDEDDGGAGAAGPTDGPSGTGNGGSTTGPGPGASSSGGPMCKIGGEACDAFEECCSSVCDNQVCTSCAFDGQSCAEATCCTGLSCYPGDWTCGTCKLETETCQNASDCCSNVCDQGVCAPDLGCSVGDCNACFTSRCAENACGAENATCDQNPDCVAIYQCLGGCTDDTCTQGCIDDHPSGYQDAIARENCMLCTQDACLSDCTGVVTCPIEP